MVRLIINFHIPSL